MPLGEENASAMSRYRVIVNPAAGAGNGERSIPKVESLMRQQGLSYDLVRTEGHWHAVELAREAALSGYDAVVACGGDGTSNEVINGLKEARQEGKSACLGIFSVGRGNDFAHTVGIPADLAQAVEALSRGHRRVIDIGRVVGGQHPQGRYFGNCVGVGFDAVGTIEASKLPRWGGFLSFLVAVLKTIFLFPYGPTVQLDFDGQSLRLPTLMVSVMNGRRLGGGFWMAPQAEPDDGAFDICVARQVSRRRIFTMIPHFLRGTQATQKEIQIVRASRITIEALVGVLPAHADGEIISTEGKRLDIELFPHGLEVISTKSGGGS